MSEERPGTCLHLPDLSITGFRGIASLTIKRLGRVTLLAGKNSVGKTTVLDAVRVYAARGRPFILSDVLKSHEEVAAATYRGDKEGIDPHLEALFHGRDASGEASFSIGPDNGWDQLRVEAIPPDKATRPSHGHPPDFFVAPTRLLKIVSQDTEQIIPWYFSPYALSTKLAKSRRIYQYLLNTSADYDLPAAIDCRSMGPALLSKDEVVVFWDDIALTDDEEWVVNSLQPVLGDQVQRIGTIGDNSNGRRVIARVRGQSFPVPLESFGDGALRLFGTALMLVNSRDGFLLIDEAENGIHHTVQRDFWRMVLETADQNNVQVLATTHSYDCVRGFAQAVNECEGIDGGLVRLERSDREMWAVEYSEDDLKVVADQHIEVR